MKINDPQKDRTDHPDDRFGNYDAEISNSRNQYNAEYNLHQQFDRTGNNRCNLVAHGLNGIAQYQQDRKRKEKCCAGAQIKHRIAHDHIVCRSNQKMNQKFAHGIGNLTIGKQYGNQRPYQFDADDLSDRGFDALHVSRTEILSYKGCVGIRDHGQWHDHHFVDAARGSVGGNNLCPQIVDAFLQDDCAEGKDGQHQPR